MSSERTPTWPAHWDKWPSIETDGERRGLVNRVRGRRSVMLNSLREASANETDRKLSRLSRRYMMSATSLVHAAASSYERRVHSLGADARVVDFVAVIDLARQINPWTGNPGRSIAIPRLKANADYRWTHTSLLPGFGMELLLKDVVADPKRVLPTQFAFSGGRPKFEKWLAARLQSAALVITTDIPSCYETISRESVVLGLPIPRKVMEKVVFRQKETAIYLKQSPKGFVPMTETEIAVVSSRSGGLPQGSAVASALVERVMKRVLDDVAGVGPGVHPACYGDNVIIVVDDIGLKQSVIMALTEAVARNFDAAVLPELTRRIRQVSPTQKFMFCQRWYQWKSEKLLISADAEQVGNFGARIAQDVFDARCSRDVVLLEKLEQRARGWLVSMPNCKSVLDEVVNALMSIEAAKKYIVLVNNMNRHNTYTNL